jgi:mRNA interferase RelE/StbE
MPLCGKGTSMINNEQLSPEEETSIQTSLEAIENGLVEFAHPDAVIDTLRELWNSDEPRPLTLRETPARYLSTTSDWLIGMTPDFHKATQHIDRKLQGRIFEAISHISRDPTAPKGDTVKPLTSDLKGFWRYRIGNSRLVYYPDSENRQITLVTFASRGSVYE